MPNPSQYTGSQTQYHYNYRPGLGNAASYQAVGHAFITGAYDIGAGQEVHIKFPYVTKKFSIIASASDHTVADATPKIRIHFVSTGSSLVDDIAANAVITNKHFIQLDGNEESFEFNVKCREVFISALNDGSGYQLYAELTRIPSTEMFPLTGSGVLHDPAGTAAQSDKAP